jgi:hypothetical protein
MIMRDSEIDAAIAVLEQFDSLPVEKRVEVLRELSPEARAALLDSVRRPRDVMRELSEEEAYFTIKYAPPDMAPAVLRAMTGNQLTYLVDLEFWKKEMFNPRSAAHWLENIAELGEEKILHFVKITDSELITLALSRLIRVHVSDPDTDIVEQSDSLPPYTLDNVFFIEFMNPGHQAFIEPILETIINWKREYYFSLMEEIAFGIHLENEAMAAQWRKARLVEHGFPEFEEALEIYGYMRKEALKDPQDMPHIGPGKRSDKAGKVFDYPVKAIEDGAFFKQSMDMIKDPWERDRLSAELAHLANKVMIADSLDPGEVDELERSLKKVSGYINMALEELCGADPEKGAGFLENNHMEHLFRRGFSLILDLRKDLHVMLRSYDGGPENLGSPLAGLAKGLIRKRPVYAEDYMGEAAPREFRDLNDIKTIRELMGRSEIEEKWEPI